jgi:hypothetical protein
MHWTYTFLSSFCLFVSIWFCAMLFYWWTKFEKNCVDVPDLARSSSMEFLPILLNLVLITSGQHVDMQSFGFINL